MPSGVHIHKLSNIDLDRMIADCAKCGVDSPIKIKTSKPRCRVSVREGKGNDKRHWKNSPGKGHRLNWYQALSLKKEFSCYVCGESDVNKLVIDHDHVSQIIRGVLCAQHNSALGFLQDSPVYVAKLMDYLKEPPVNKLPQDIPKEFRKD